ncbi:ATP-binding cassette domain-containing protein [Saccharospirillum salsuginis]|uniref:ABC transporter ATP-binding protein n=1 Tax=Saccharospirillum salsuginis TaxID=418750 RepID=A0A918N774_9GAMM|nr:ATP-binding cassette domain-containing protein [Saccharospirillum salsuginis]GGX42013.1 ABC transporter ATP-binding protein [Saccharospirillum salsuginis]
MTFELKNVTVTLDEHPLFAPLTVQLDKGQIGTIMGPSGSGKSTLLAAISGTLPPTFDCTGDIRLNGRSLLDVPVESRQVGILFQDDLLFPHLNVYQNLVFALPRGLSKSEQRERICSGLIDADMDRFDHRDVATLSGGQRARISLLRTLLAEPKLILLDEPFAKLDLQLRGQFRDFVFNRITDLNIPALLVTHDPADHPDTGLLIELETAHA